MHTNDSKLTTGENESMVLEEEIDENYEPTQEEILEYSQYIGLDPEADKNLMYLAKEGLKAPLPNDWKPCQNREGKIYYFNFKTKQSQWEHPCDEYYKKRVQDTKRKKEEKPSNKLAGNKQQKSPIQKNAFNMPFAKQDSLPAVKKSGAPQQSYNQSLEASFSADNNMFTMNHKMSFSNDYQEHNSLTDKKFDGKVLPADFESFQSLGSENALINSDELQIESEEKLDDYRSKELGDIEKLMRTHRDAEAKVERQLKQKVERELQELKNELSANGQQGNSAEFIKEKEAIRSSMKTEYKKKTEMALQKLENEYAVKKKEVEASEAKKLNENRQADEDKIKEEFETKQAALVEEKKKLEIEREKMRAKEKSQKAKLEEELEREKQDIIEDYASLLREAEAEELYTQKQEIEVYRRELQSKLVEEKKTLVLAKKQKESINLTRKSELNDFYARRLKLEQEKVDTEMQKSLKEYEDNERRKKDADINRLHNMELAHERERNQMALQEEIEQLQAGYTDRLSTYQKVLKDKFRKEKNALDKEVTKTIEEYRRGVDSIKASASTREEILNQISRISITKDIKKEIAELDEKIEIQQDANRQLKSKVESLKNQERARQNQSTQLIDELRKKIKDAEAQIVKLTQKNQRRNEMPRQRPKSLQNAPKPIVRSNSVLGAIKKDVKDIKAFLTKRESVPRPSRRDGYESSRLSEVSRRDSPGRKGSVPRYEDSRARTYRDWSEFVDEEENRIQTQKLELNNEKRVLRKDRESVATEREMHKREQPTLLSITDEDPEYYRKEVRKRKNSLNTQIYQLNSKITRLRGDEAQLKNKEKSFRYLKDAVEKFENEELGSHELEAIYQNYQETDVLQKSDNENRYRPSVKENRGSVLSNRKSLKFFQNWRDSINNGQPTDDSDLESNRTRGERASVSYRAYGKENMRNGNISREKVRRTRPGSHKPGLEAGYSYTSLIDVLDMKIKQETRISTSSFIGADVTGIKENRVQANNFFSQHSQWLKEMKDQLNKQLYERPTKSTVSMMK